MIHGTEESIKVHMDGLARVVHMRGGIQNSGLPFLVTRMIVWYVTW